MTPEGKIQRAILAALGAEPDLLLMRNEIGHAIYLSKQRKEYRVPYGLGVGSPDLVGVLKSSGGRLFALEVKVPGKSADEDQCKCHAIWQSFGAFVAVVHSVEEAKTALARARRERAARVALPGWFCAACRVFNGDVKERRTHCRACGAARKEGDAPCL